MHIPVDRKTSTSKIARTPISLPDNFLQPSLSIGMDELVANTLLQLWQEHISTEEQPIILHASGGRDNHPFFQPILLEALVNKQDLSQPGQLLSWQYLAVDTLPHLLAFPLAGPLLAQDLCSEITLEDQENAVVGQHGGYMLYHFAQDWSMLAALFTPNQDGTSYALLALPSEHIEDWRAFLKRLNTHLEQIERQQYAGRVHILGDEDEDSIIPAILNMTAQDVILPVDVRQTIQLQHSIFEQPILDKYAQLKLPRLRKILLAGPPGSGKSTLLKVIASEHVKKGGSALYVCAGRGRFGHASWERVEYALALAAKNKLPTLVLIEDFEQFISPHEDHQRVLNVLDGISTPDNPAGTLLVGTTNAPEQIDPRIKDRPGRIDLIVEIGAVQQDMLIQKFLERYLDAAFDEAEHLRIVPQLVGQTGSHIREVCLLAAMQTMQKQQAIITCDDLLWAHDTILRGREVAADHKRFLPPAPKGLLSRIGFSNRK